MISGHYFDIRRLDDKVSPKVELLQNGTSTGVVIDGASLLAQYQTENGDILLILDEDCPFEEMLHFVLMRHEKILDHLSYGAAYTSGIFLLKDVGAETIFFTFSSNDLLALRVLQNPTRWKNNGAPGSRHHMGWLTPKYLTLDIVSS
jgi:hypothetical protein